LLALQEFSPMQQAVAMPMLYDFVSNIKRKVSFQNALSKEGHLEARATSMVGRKWQIESDKVMAPKDYIVVKKDIHSRTW
jgi:hypothetical protein